MQDSEPQFEADVQVGGTWRYIDRNGKATIEGGRLTGAATSASLSGRSGFDPRAQVGQGCVPYAYGKSRAVRSGFGLGIHIATWRVTSG